MERIQKCPRFSTICSVVDGDEIAMEKILNHIMHTYQKHVYVLVMMNMEICGLWLIWI